MNITARSPITSTWTTSDDTLTELQSDRRAYISSSAPPSSRTQISAPESGAKKAPTVSGPLLTVQGAAALFQRLMRRSVSAVYVSYIVT